MNKQDERPRAIEGISDPNSYTAPEITILEVTLEKGFAASDSTVEDLDPDTW
ncbi:MAG: hypothetical protein WC110_11490 [Bacteroidales bacterium]|jgi:hypothetical protein|nr:hypothetical protein [Bacteroidales bacterium]